MAAGGEIKVVLTLDDSGFSVKTKKAAEIVDSLNAGFRETTKSSKTAEADMGALGKSVSDISSKLKVLDSSLNTFVERIASTTAKFESLASGFKSVGRSSKALSEGLDPAGKSMVEFSRGAEKLRASLASLKPSLQKAAEGQTAYAKAQAEATQIAKESSAKQISYNEASLRSSRETNNALIESKRKYAAELASVDAEIRSKAIASRVEADNIERKLGAYGGRNKMAPHLENAARLDANSAQIQREIANSRDLIASKEAENAEIEKQIEITRRLEDAQAQQAAASRAASFAEGQRLAAERTAAQAALRAQEEAAAERKRLALETGRFEREQLRQTMEMMKGFGELWGAMKIEHGMKKSVDTASEYQRQLTLLQGMNLSAQKTGHIVERAAVVAQQLGFASTNQVMNAYRGAIGIVGADNPAVLDRSLPYALKAARNVGFAAGDSTPEAVNSNLLNIVGFAKSRGQLTAQGIIDNANLLQKLAIGSGGKMTLSDMEMIAKRNLGDMPHITDVGFAKLVALAEELKTSGHGGGGGSSGQGVSLIGTSMAMVQKMMEGGLKTVEAAKKFAAMGVINMDTFDPAMAGSKIKALRQAGLTMGDLSMVDPVAAIQKFAQAAEKYMTDPKNRKHYFGNQSITDPNAMSAALARFANELGMSKTVVSSLENIANPAVMENTMALSNQMMHSKNTSAMSGSIDKTYQGQMQSFSSSITDLEKSLGSKLLPVLGEVASAITKVIQAANDFVTKNPISADMLLMAGAAGTAVLAFNGLKSVFGVVGSLRSVFDVLASGSRTAATEEEALIVSNTTLKSSLPALDEGLVTTGAAVEGFGATAVATMGTIGSAITAILPYIGIFIAAWDLANVVANLKVGGAEIKVWAADLMDWLGTKFENGWLHIKDIFTLGMNHASIQAQIDVNNKSHRDAAKANGIKSDAGLSNPNANTRSGIAFLPSDAYTYQDPRLGLAAHAYTYKDPRLSAHSTAHASDGTPSTAAAFAAATAGGHHSKRAFENLFNQAFDNEKINLDKINAKIANLGSTKPRDYGSEAHQFVAAQLDKGIYDKGHNPLLRQEFLNKGYSMTASGGYMHGKMKSDAAHAVNWNAKDSSGKTLNDMANEQAAVLKARDDYNALAFAKQRLAAVTTSLSDKMSLAAHGGIATETRAMKALVAEFARQAILNPAGFRDPKVAHARAATLMAQATMDGMGALSTIKSADSLIHSPSLGSDGGANQKAPLASFFTFFGKKAQRHTGVDLTKGESFKPSNAGTQRIDANSIRIKGAYEQAMAGYNATLNAPGANKSTAAYANALAQQKALDKAYTQFVQDSAAAREKALLTPIEKMTIAWQHSQNLIKGQEVSWANGLLGSIESGMTTGHFTGGIRQAFANIFTSIRNDLLKQLVAAPIEKLVTGIGGGAQGILGSGNAIGAGESALGGAAMNGLMSLFSGPSNGTGAYTSAFSGAFNNPSAYSAGATGNTSGAGFIPMIAGFFSHFFADGGIMTNMGSVSLKKYANGGIANSPQLSVFGEGRNPEAYVPLPDGRSIPVTMQGQGSVPNQQTSSAGGVTISIVVNNSAGGASTSSTTASGEQSAIWSGMAAKIKGVVQQEMITQQRPGGLLYK